MRMTANKAANRLRRRGLSYLAIAGLLAQVFLTGLYAPAMAFSGAPGASDGLRTVLICTGTGVKYVTLDAQGRPVPADIDADTDADGASFCPICFGVAGGVAVAAAPVAQPYVPSLAPLSLSRIAFPWPPNGPPLRPNSRGPPA